MQLTKFYHRMIWQNFFGAKTSYLVIWRILKQLYRRIPSKLVKFVETNQLQTKMTCQLVLSDKNTKLFALCNAEKLQICEYMRAIRLDDVLTSWW